MRQKKNEKIDKKFGVFKFKLTNGYQMKNKSDMKIYQNAQIFYERGDMEEDSVKRLPGRRLRRSLLAHNI